MYRKVFSLGEISLLAGSNAWTPLPSIDLDNATSLWIAGSRSTPGAWTTSSASVDLFGRIGEDSTGVKLVTENRSDNYYLSVKAEVNGVENTDLYIRTNGAITGTINLVAVVYYG